MCKVKQKSLSIPHHPHPHIHPLQFIAIKNFIFILFLFSFTSFLLSLCLSNCHLSFPSFYIILFVFFVYSYFFLFHNNFCFGPKHFTHTNTVMFFKNDNTAHPYQIKNTNANQNNHILTMA